MDLTNKLCLTPRILTDVFALRYVSYREKNFIPENDEELFYDKYDAMPSSFTFAVYVGDQIVGTMRACVLAPAWGWDEIPAGSAHREELRLWGVAHPVVVEWSRLAISPAYRDMAMQIELALLGSVPFFASHLPSPSFVCAVREEHGKFYSRFGYECISGSSNYPGVSFPTRLMAMEWEPHKERIRNHRIFSRSFEYQPSLDVLDERSRRQFEARMGIAQRL